jgi:hypothetical protein
MLSERGSRCESLLRLAWSYACICPNGALFDLRVEIDAQIARLDGGDDSATPEELSQALRDRPQLAPDAEDCSVVVKRKRRLLEAFARTSRGLVRGEDVERTLLGGGK